MENSNKPYYIIASSAFAGVLLALLHQHLKNNYHKDQNIEPLPIFKNFPRLQSRKNIERKNSLPPSYNRIKLSVNSKFESDNSLVEELNFLDTPSCEIFKVNHLAWDMEMFDFPSIVSPLMCQAKNGKNENGKCFLPENSFIFMNSFTLSVSFFSDATKLDNSARWLRAGPRKNLFFRPEEVRAAIVSCGSLCPGTNVLVQEITNSLYNNYGVKQIYGVKFGYRGFYKNNWIELSPDLVESIHHDGGMFLGTSRGGFDLEKILESLIKKNINQVYIMGGLGTMQGALSLYKAIKHKKLKISINIIPKTICNDIPLIDTCFGFESCVENSQRAIRSAYNEITSYEHGVGIIKLIGRECGFLAVESSMASRDVNICLIPEIGYELYGPKGLLNFVIQRVKTKQYCIIVVSEGAGDSLLDDVLPDRGVDESGNKKPGDIGLFLKDKIRNHGLQNDLNINVKYIDPTFLIRSVEPNSLDKKLATRIAQNTVHCSMAGFTGYGIGIVNKSTVLIPADEMLSEKYARSILPYDPNWQRLLNSNGQPSFINDPNIYMGKE